MANGKTPTRKQRKVIENCRLNSDNWLILKNPPGKLYIVNKNTRKKRVINYVCLVTCLFLFLLSPGVLAEELPQVQNKVIFKINSNSIEIDGESYQVDAAPFIQNGRTLVPIKYLSESLGANVSWVNDEAILEFKDKNKTLILKPEALFLNNNGKYQLMDVVPVIIPPGRMCLPARYVCEAVGYNVTWDESQQTVIVTAKS